MLFRPVKSRFAVFVFVVSLAGSIAPSTAPAEMLAAPTFDVDSYIFLGTTADPSNQFDAQHPEISVATDYSGGVVDGANVHFVFSVIQFDDLTGLETKANGGPNKYLTLTTASLPEASVIGVSVAAEDILSSTNGYPGHPSLFPGNPTGVSTDRLQWYMDNIKGDDANYGGYAGGATHIGLIDVAEEGTYSIDVTSTVDAWISGSLPNYGFGLWGIDAPGGPGTTITLASTNNPSGNGPTLESLPVGGKIPGDFDSDGDVDGDDFLQWQSEFGGVPVHADADDDGDVDGDDFLIWQSNFGTSSGEAATGAVPEPAGALIALLTLLSAFCYQGLRR